MDDALLAALARAAEWHLDDFKMQNLANTVWAFAVADRPDALLFVVLARVHEWCLDKFSEQNIANTAWAFATADQCDAELFAAVTRAMSLRMENLKA